MEYKGISDTEVFKLMDVLSINAAAALIAGASPTDVMYDEQYDSYYININNTDHNQSASKAFAISRQSLIDAVTIGRLKAHIVPSTYNQKLFKNDLKQDWIAKNGLCSKETIIDRDNLKEWLEARGVYPPMLFPNGKKDDYINPEHPHYAPKLALCVKAWEAAQTAIIQGETYKQFMVNWMVKNAKTYGVENTKKELEKLASVSNWATSGGRAKSEPTLPLDKDSDSDNKDFTDQHELLTNLPNKPVAFPIDDDIPF